MSKRDAFEDLAELRNDAPLGVLSGEGAVFLEKVKSGLEPDGIHSTCSCGNCARTVTVIVGYDEAVIGSLGLMPPGWKLDQKTRQIYPNVSCAGCESELKLFFTPGELQRYVNQAAQAGGQIQIGNATVQAGPGLQSYVGQIKQRAGIR